MSKYHNEKVAGITRTATRVGLGLTGETAKVVTGAAVGVGQAVKPVVKQGVEAAKPWLHIASNWLRTQVEKAKEKGEELERSREIERKANGEKPEVRMVD